MTEPDEPMLTGAVMAQRHRWGVELSPTVIVGFDEMMLPRRHARRRLGAPSPAPFRRVVQLADRLSMVIAPGMGAPVAAVTVEFLAALGVERLIVVGTAGDLHGDPALGGEVLVVDAAVSDEGTAAHYMPSPANGRYLCDPAMTQVLATGLQRPVVTTVSTDVPFRHTSERLSAHRSSAAVVEMELSAVIAAATRFGLAAAAAVVVSDHFGEASWFPATADIGAAGRSLVSAVTGVYA